MIPQAIYYFLLFGSGAGIILSVVGLFYSAIKKRSKKRIALWAIIFVICLIVEALVLNGKIVGHMMVGG